MRVLAVGCHPDDLEIACAGTLRKYVKRGDEVYVCHVANGNKGHRVIPPDELRVMRHGEAERAAAVEGAKKVFDLDIGDLCVDSSDMNLKVAMIRVIKEVAPDVIITHSPNDYMVDHTEVSKLVFDASFGASISYVAEQHSSCSHTPISSICFNRNSFNCFLSGSWSM